MMILVMKVAWRVPDHTGRFKAVSSLTLREILTIIYATHASHVNATICVASVA